MLSELKMKRTRAFVTSLAIALFALSLSLSTGRALAAPFGILDEPKPADSKDKKETEEDKDEDETSDEKKSDEKKDDKDTSDDKKDGEKKDDAGKSDVEAERERVARENEAAKKKALEQLGPGMSDTEKAAFEAQLEALKQEAIKSVGKTPATKPAPKDAPTGETPKTNRTPQPTKDMREKLGGRKDIAPKPESAMTAEEKASHAADKTRNASSDLANKMRAKRDAKADAKADARAAKEAEAADTAKSGADKRKEAIEKAQERAKARREEMEAKRRARMGGIKSPPTTNDNDSDDDGARARSRTRPAPRTPKAPDDDSGEEGAGAQSPFGEIPLQNITINAFPEPEREFTINYENTPWMEVVSDFARMSHKPFVRNVEDEIPGELTYFSIEKLSYDEAYHKLNDLLFEQPLNNFVIQRLPDRITVVRIPDLLNKIPIEHIFASFDQFKAANLDPYTPCQTQYVVPDNYTPYQIIDEYRSQFSDTYGVKIADKDKLELTGFAKEHLYFDSMIRHLTDINPSDTPPVFEVIQLNHAKANDVVTMLRQLYPIQATATPPPGRRGRRGRRQPQPQAIAPDLEDADQVNIVADAKANKLYITAPDYYMKELRMRIAELDVPSDDPPEMRRIPLYNADASTVINQILPIIQDLQAKLTKLLDHVDPMEKAKYDITLYPSGNGNGIIIVGGLKGIDWITPIIEAHDVEPDWITKSIPLFHRDASYIVERLTNAMPESGGTPVRRGRPAKGGPAAVPDTTPGPQIEIESSRSLFVSATQFDMNTIEDLIQKLDVVDPEEPSEHFIYLQCAIPTQAAQTVQQIMAEDSAAPVVQPAGKGNAQARAAARRQAARRARGRSTQSGGDGPLIIPNDADQSLLVYCSDTDWTEVQRLIDRLEANACNVEPKMVQFKLSRAEPTDVAAAINDMFPAPAGATQIVNADSYNKTVKIYATPMFIEKITPLIQKLDENSIPGLVVIKLQYAKAEIIAPIIQQAVPESQYLSPVAGINQAKAAATKGKAPPRRANPRRVAQSAGDTSVRIVAEPVTNSLLVTAPPDKLKTIEDLVAQMEAVAEARKPEKVIVNVVNREADEIAGVLTSILNATKTAGAGKDGATGGSVNPTDVEISITAIGDQLILFGPQDEVSEAVKLIAQIDTLDAMPITRKVKVYDAEEDEKKLRTMLSMKASTAIAINQTPAQNAGRGRNRRPTTKAPAAQQLTDAGATVSDVQIFANTYENTLLIRAMPKDWKVIDDILQVILSEEV
ncbi:MAG: hypothetical protein KDA33_08690, partial [Phycisphaerales bacterium]|nr:hypothetical protein [Phycisphaerales bacterium]